MIQHNIIQFIVSFILFHSFIVTVIPPFPYLPLTISTAPSFLYCGEYFPLRIALKCMREQVNDITVITNRPAGGSAYDFVSGIIPVNKNDVIKYWSNDSEDNYNNFQFYPMKGAN